MVDEDALDLFEQMVAVDKFEQSVLGCAERQCRDRAAGGEVGDRAGSELHNELEHCAFWTVDSSGGHRARHGGFVAFVAFVGGFGYRVAFSTTAITSLIALGLLRLQMAPRWRTLTQPVALASSASS